MKRVLLAGTALAAVLTLSTAQGAEQSPTIIKLMTRDIVVEPNGLDTMTLHLEVSATNDAAAMAVGQTSLPYRESMQDLEVIEAYTLKADSRRLPVSPNAIYTQQPQSAPQLQAFDDVRQKVIVFPNVAAGDTIVYTARWREKLPVIPGHFTHTEFFTGAVSYNEVRGSITAPKSLPLKVENHDVNVERRETVDAVTYSWRFSATASATVDRPYVSPLDRLPRILVSSLADHDELGRTYAALLAPKEAVTPRIQALADQLTSGITDRRQQAEKIYEWVSKNIRYVAVDIGNGGIIPHDADVTLVNGYGDCKDHVVLFAALLKAKGIASEVALINLGNTYTVPSVSMIFPFNHVITWLPEFGLYVDTTAGVAPFGVLPFGEYGKPVVHAVASGGALRQTPVLAVGNASVSLKTVARLDRDGKVSGESTVSATGPFGLQLRGTGLAIQAAGPARFAAAALDEQGVKGTGTIDVPPPTELGPSYSLTSRFEYTDPDALSGMSFAPVRGLWLTAVTGDSLMGSIFDTAQSETEATACFSGRAEEDLTLELPAGTPPASVPADVQVRTPNLQFSARWSVSGSTINLRREFISTIDAPLCTGESRRQTVRALDQIRNHYEFASLSYSAGQAVLSDADPDVSAGTAAYDRGDYQAAIQLLTTALGKTDLAPELRIEALTLRGDAYNLQRDYPQAIADYTELLRLKPDQPMVLNARGTSFRATRQYDGAVADFTEAIRLAPDEPEYYSERANTFQTQNKLAEAAADYGSVIRLKPDDPLAYTNRAQVYERDGLFERAIADCDSAIRLGRTAADCRMIRGSAYYFLARYEQALADLSVAIQLQPAETLGYFRRAFAYLATEQPERARSDFDAVLRLQPNDPRSLYGRAVANERLGNQPSAEADLAAARRINPNAVIFMSGLGVVRGPYTRGKDDLELCKAAVTNRDVFAGTIFCSRALAAANLGSNDKSMAHVHFAALHRDRRHFEEAQTHYDEALRLTPNSATVYVERGLTYRESNDPGRAMQSYDQAIRLDPRLAGAFFYRAFSYQAKGDLDTAINDYTQAISIDPGHIAAFINRGNIYGEKGQHADALRDYDQAIRLNPRSQVAFNARCYALATSGKAQEAIADCDMALSLRPDYWAAMDSRGYAYLRLQNYAAAIRDYDAALSANPNLAVSLFGRGVAKIKTGNSAEGNTDISEAIKRDPQVAEKMAKLGVTP